MKSFKLGEADEFRTGTFYSCRLIFSNIMRERATSYRELGTILKISFNIGMYYFSFYEFIYQGFCVFPKFILIFVCYPSSYAVFEKC